MVKLELKCNNNLKYVDVNGLLQTIRYQPILFKTIVTCVDVVGNVLKLCVSYLISKSEGNSCRIQQK